MKKISAQFGLTAAVLVLFLAACGGLNKISDLNELSRELVSDGTAIYQGRKVERKCELPDGFKLADDFDIEKHLVVSNSEGKLPEERDNVRHEGSAGLAFRTVMGGFARYAEARATKKDPARLLIYLNGGLNSQEVVERQAARQIPCMLADGFYPVFFVWDTNGYRSYKEQVLYIHEGQRSTRGSARFLSPFRVMGDVFSGVGDTPVDLLVHGRRFYRAVGRKPPCQMIVVLKYSHRCAKEHYCPEKASPVLRRNY